MHLGSKQIALNIVHDNHHHNNYDVTLAVCIVSTWRLFSVLAREGFLAFIIFFTFLLVLLNFYNEIKQEHSLNPALYVM